MPLCWVDIRSTFPNGLVCDGEIVFLKIAFLINYFFFGMYVPHGIYVEVRGYHLAGWVSLSTM